MHVCINIYKEVYTYTCMCLCVHYLQIRIYLLCVVARANSALKHNYIFTCMFMEMCLCSLFTNTYTCTLCCCPSECGIAA